MRVAHIITRLIVGGAQENTVSTVLGLQQKEGVSVRLYAGPTRGAEGSVEPLVAGQQGLFYLIPQLVRAVHPVKDFMACLCLSRELTLFKPDIVHTHSGKAGILGRCAARRAGVPVIVHSIHGPSFGPFQGGIVNWMFRAAERRAGRWTTHFVTVADAMTEQYLQAGIGDPERYTRIFSGFDLMPFTRTQNDPTLRAELGIDADDFVVGKIARLFMLKGHDDLFRSASALVKQCPRIKFLLIGDGIWRERLESQARDIGLANRFVFAGLISPNQIPKLVGIMDALVHLSKREGLPRALPQAMAAGKPVVAFDQDGVREVCIPDETGFLVRSGDLASFERALLTLAESPSLCKRFGRSGQRFVRERFGIQTLVDAQFSLYQKLLAARKAGS